MDMQLALSILASVIIGVAVALFTRELPPLLQEIIQQQLGSVLKRADEVFLPSDWYRRVLLIWPVGLIVTFVGLWLGLNNLPVACVVTTLCYIAPGAILRSLIRRREDRLRDQMVGTTIELANATRSQPSLEQGLQRVGEVAQSPISHVLKRIVHNYQHGQTLQDALSQMQKRLKLEPFALITASLKVSMKEGGQTHEALDRISRSLLDHQRLERKMSAETASGRRVVQILALFPLIFTALLFVLDRDATFTLYSNIYGQVVTAISIATVYGGTTWAYRMMDLKV